MQLVAYMYRFDAKKGYYLYPEAEGLSDGHLWLNKGTTYEKNVKPRDDVSVVKHGLKIPNDAEDYKDFVSKIEVIEKALLRECVVRVSIIPILTLMQYYRGG